MYKVEKKRGKLDSINHVESMENMVRQNPAGATLIPVNFVRVIGVRIF